MDMAAPSPVTPVDFKAVVVNAGDRACDVLSKLSTLTALVDDLVDWMMNDDGTVSEDFQSWVGTSGSGLDAPASVSATENLDDRITVTWGSVEGATNYKLYRGTTNDTDDMTLIEEDATSPYDDTTPTADIVYWYAVKAYNATLTSAFSTPNDGKMVSSTTPTDPVIWDYSGTDAKTVTVPTGANRMEVELWGAGGYGGQGPPVSWGAVPPSPTRYSGGGGASGSYYHVSSVEVTEGEAFSILVGASGVQSRVSRDADGTFAYATPGGNGGEGSYTVIGTAGQPAALAGGHNFATGSEELDISVGNAASGATGGAALSAGGQGAGGNGTTDSLGFSGTLGPSGTSGRVKITFTTV